ncbi:MAG TPA: class I SAM-dependent RNA methyltransferase [Anaerolineales bacterium]|nr:class I SAM-dependent RNA methyltransferase [Anaerolineales bacterium]
MTTPARLSLFAVSPPGLEDLTCAELFALGINHPRAVSGGVEFNGFLTHLYRVNLWSRTASRVLIRIGEFEAKAFDELHRKTAALPWENFLRPDARVEVRTACHKSKLYHSDAVTQRVEDAIRERLGQKNSPQSRQGRKDSVEKNSASFALLRLRILARLDHDHCTLSLDSSGAHLHQRGYRLATAKAPLRETLAAALLLHVHYDPTQPILDPFCGSGTFAIEAALLARNIAPGLNRRFAFMDWINFDEKEWNELMNKAREQSRESAPAPILASDRDEGAVAAAAANADRAGVLNSIDLTPSALSAIQPPSPPGLVIANLPYGKRVGDDVRDLYAQFGNVMREKCAGWRVGFIAGSIALAKQTRLPFGEPLWIENGGLRVPFIQTKT